MDPWWNFLALILYVASPSHSWRVRSQNMNVATMYPIVRNKSLEIHTVYNIAKNATFTTNSSNIALFVSDIPHAKFASCRPIQTPIDIPNYDMTVFYEPKCVFVQRCAGCCLSERLRCHPSKKSIQYFKVLRARYMESSQFRFEGYVIVPLIKHEECSCQCKFKARHCSPNQVYQKDQCRCICPNENNMVNCKDNKYWDNKNCICKCKEIHPCSSGAVFNNKICRCQTIKRRKSNPNRRIQNYS